MTDEFLSACYVVDFNKECTVAKFLYAHNTDETELYNTFATICIENNINIAKRLWKRYPNIDIYKNMHHILITACIKSNVDMVSWIVSTAYNSHKYVSFLIEYWDGGEFAGWRDVYTEFSNEIKDILIEYNLVNPVYLSRDDVLYYLSRTNNVIPDTILFTDIPVHKRGKCTKPAIR